MERSLLAAKIGGAAAAERSEQDGLSHAVAHRHEGQDDRGHRVRPEPAPRPVPEVGHQALGIHRALGCPGAAGGVDQQRQRVRLIGNERAGSGKALTAGDNIGQGFHDHRAARLRQPVTSGLHRLALVVDLGTVVEHHQTGGGVAGQHQFDRVGQVIDAGRDYARLGLGDNGRQLR